MNNIESLSHYVEIFVTDPWKDKVSVYVIPITIDGYALTSFNTIILKVIIIRNGATVVTGAVVIKDVPDM